MFTGLIEDVGTIGVLRLENNAAVLTVKTNLPVHSMPRGASVAVNGACLTVVRKSSKTFTVDVSPETLQRTNLETLAVGHVDGLGTIETIEQEGEFTIVTFAVPALLGALLVPKGSVAVDGISLTVNVCRKRRFSVAIIPFTMKHTNLRARKVGDKVNIETDLIGKYVQSFMRRR